jgi:hypothetical protein
MSWRPPDRRRNRVKLGVGKAWISLDSLVRIEPFQWVTSDFLRNFFHARSWSLRRARRFLSGGSLRRPSPPSQCDSEILSSIRARYFAGPIALDHETVTRFWQENVGILIHGFVVVVLPCPEAFDGVRAIAPASLRCQTSANMAIEIPAVELRRVRGEFCEVLKG